MRLAKISALFTLGAVLAIASSTTKADVVFGNLGNAGTGNLGSTVTDFGSNPPITDLTQRLAQGFVTGASADFLTVQTITLGLFAATPPAPTIDMSVGIYPSVDGAPGPTPVFTSSTVSIGDTGKYTFGFSDAVLSPSTPYWIVPSTPSTGSWVNNLASSAPIGRNGSGYTYVGALRFGDLDEEGPPVGWYSAPTNGMAVSINAVPEPSTYVIAAIGIGVAGLMGRRRRKVAVDAAAAI